MEELAFRPIRDGDWPAILDLAHRSLGEVPSPPKQDDWLRNRRTFSPSDGYQHHFVATLEQRIAGYAAIECLNDSAPGVYRLYVVVAPGDRESLGTALFEELRSHLLQLNARRAWMLEYTSDRSFMAFLQKLGFAAVNTVGLPDGTAAVRIVIDAPFRPGATPTAPIIDQTAGARFASHRVAENYLFRAPYSREVFDILLALFGDRPRILLDAGCGPGKITLGLIDHLDRADAVDPSAEMLRVARSLPKGGEPKIRWIQSTMEDAALDPPYGLIAAGESIHWMDIPYVLRKFAATLAPGGFLALVAGDGPVDPPWLNDERTFMLDFIRNISGKHPAGWRDTRERLYEPLLINPGFERIGHQVTSPMALTQTISDYLRCEHSRASWSEDHLGEKLSAEFDAAMTRLLTPHARDGVLHFSVQTRVEWGRLRVT
jgi:SAM-dependent methyltransferase/N-acetylglutamate synthase-like GNAT family acetyltransferase